MCSRRRPLSRTRPGDAKSSGNSSTRFMEHTGEGWTARGHGRLEPEHTGRDAILPFFPRPPPQAEPMIPAAQLPGYARWGAGLPALLVLEAPLWVHGEAGCGVSSLAAWIAQ